MKTSVSKQNFVPDTCPRLTKHEVFAKFSEAKTSKSCGPQAKSNPQNIEFLQDAHCGNKHPIKHISGYVKIEKIQ